MNRRHLFCLVVSILFLGGCASYQEASTSASGTGALDHVFLIMMENHGYGEIINNTDAPYINAMAKRYGLATHYQAVGHPSLPNYLEVVGGSNFGTNHDRPPHWGSAKNTKHSYGFIPTHGIDIAANSGYKLSGGAPFIGKTIADQLEEAGRSWKTYQESLPIQSRYNISTSDGKKTIHGPHLYADKHNPFEYFRSTQGSKNIVGYTSNLHRLTIDGKLAQDLVDGTIADFSFIAPNLCHDMHGAHSCSQPDILIRDGDKEVQALVDAITGSAMWKTGRNAIIVMWDEDYNSGHNRVPLIVETNYQSKAIHSSRAYNHFSLLKTMEKGFGLRYLNHANDPKIHAMSDIFALR